jgi:hypothetical protein
MPSKPTVPRVCIKCGTGFLVRKIDVRLGKGVFCSRSCASKEKVRRLLYKSGESNPNWKGGLIQSKKGYWYVKKPDHPRAGSTGYVKRADLVLEQKLGRPLTDGELAHHQNEDKTDDSPNNLELSTTSDHAKLHHPKQPAKLKVRSSDPRTRRYTWPSNEELLELGNKHSLRQIAPMIGCSWKAVHKKLQALRGTR